MKARMTPETRRLALRRMKIISGQVQALEKQLEDDRYCMDILDRRSRSRRRFAASMDSLSKGTFARTSLNR